VQTPSHASPLGLVQESLERGPLHGWRLLVACCLVDRVRGERARPVVAEVLARWPTPSDLALAGGELERSLRTLGLATRRAKTLRSLSSEWDRGEWLDPSELPGVGAYARTCWAIWVECEVPEEEPSDGWLAAWWRWARAEARGHRVDGRPSSSRPSRLEIRAAHVDTYLGDAVLTCAGVAKVVGISTRHARELLTDGRLPGRLVAGRRGWVTTLSAVLEWARGDGTDVGRLRRQGAAAGVGRRPGKGRPRSRPEGADPAQIRDGADRAETAAGRGFPAVDRLSID
jgi:hypothetical protein